jgi:uncharacterized protein YbjT (DUF2867 family)
MDVVIAGGHGKVALRLERLLAQGGHRPRGIVRNPDHVPDLEGVGAEAVVLDLERAPAEEVARVLAGADAAVFAAGAGPGSGPERKRTVDLGAAVKLLEACEQAGVRRYVIVSSIGAHDPAGASEQMRPYLEAKAEADAAVMASALDWTVVRPGSLTDAPGTGRIRIETEMGHRGPVPRDDVAATLAAVLEAPSTIGKAFEVFAGDTPIAEALARL